MIPVEDDFLQVVNGSGQGSVAFDDPPFGGWHCPSLELGGGLFSAHQKKKNVI